MSVSSSPDAWLDHVAGELPEHARVLRALLTAVRGDARIRTLELEGSLGRDDGDECSDLDAGMGIADDAWPAILDDVAGLVAPAGEVVDLLEHRLEQWGERPHLRVAAQYRRGVQLDLVLYPASRIKGRTPSTRVLHDPDGRFDAPYEHPLQRATAQQVREWTFLGWWALGDIVKYLQRDSPWEALERLGEARTNLWRLWGVAQRVDYPVFGVTSVLDAPDPRPPHGIDATAATLDAASLRRAALACADLLDDVLTAAARATGADPTPPALAAWVSRRLAALPHR